MTNETALEILQRMADGVDPDTGELLAADHLCNRPAVIRALIAATRALSAAQPAQPNAKTRKRDRQSAATPQSEGVPASASVAGLERAGLPWTQDEDALLKTLHAARWPIPSIAAKMQRSDYSIYCRMERLELYGEQYGYPAEDHQPKWTRADDETLREMHRSGISAAEMAQSLQRTEKSIAARLFYMGLTKDSPLPPLRKKQ